MNINRLIDIELNKDFIKSFLGDYTINSNGISSATLRYMPQSLSKTIGVKSIIRIDKSHTFDDIDKFLSMAVIDGCDDWRLPSIELLEKILKNISGGYGNEFWSERQKYNPRFAKTVEKTIFNNEEIISIEWESNCWNFNSFIVR